MLISINQESKLYSVTAGKGYTSCLGFQVCERLTENLAKELIARKVIQDYTPQPIGTPEAYALYESFQHLAKQHHDATGYRFTCELTKQLIGFEGKKVKAVDCYGEERKFKVGKSTGWIPIHLEIEGNSRGGFPASESYKSIQVL